MSTTIKNIRLKNFQRICHEYRFSRDISDKIGKSESYISQIRSGTKPIGSLVAREIERAFKLPEGYMDVSHETEPITTVPESTCEFSAGNGVQALLLAMRMVSPTVRQSFINLAVAIASESPQKNNNNTVVIDDSMRMSQQADNESETQD